jgi:glycosyltransferase involved in cell wall biosynthesis
MRQHGHDFELILVDDASHDDTVSVINDCLSGNSELRLIRLSRRFGTDVAMRAGLETTLGDFVVMIRPELDPPDEIPGMLALASSGYGVITGVFAAPREGWFSGILRRAFHYYTNKTLGLNYPPHGTLFQVLSRPAVAAVIRSRSHRPIFPVLASQVGYGGQTYRYRTRLHPRAKSPDRLWTKIERGLAVIVSQSIAPLRLVSYVGASAALLNLIIAFGLVVSNAFYGNLSGSGWTVVSFQMSLLFVFLFSVLVVLCEYVGRTLSEVMDRPLYHVLEERNGSPVLPFSHRQNVMDRSA